MSELVSRSSELALSFPKGRVKFITDEVIIPRAYGRGNRREVLWLLNLMGIGVTVARLTLDQLV